ncbi:MAG: hypothetical protein WDM80_02285 [Limisphaerales bacterium]
MKPLPPLFCSAQQESDCRQLHANVSKMPVYQFERLAFTDAANLPSVNEIVDVKVKRSLFKNVWRFWQALF